MKSAGRKPTPSPPAWANRFLEWYCNPELLDEIQGDVLELYYREAAVSKRKADWKFIWNVIRFCRWKNIRKRKQQKYFNSTGMLQNIFKVAVRNFFRQPGHSLLNIAGLAVSFTAAVIIGLWIMHETSFDTFHHKPDQIFKVMSHVNANGTLETYGSARANINLEAIPEITEKAVVITGSRWPNELCFRPEDKPHECIYLFGIFSEKTFFSMFSFPVLKGDKNPLASPGNIAISESMAYKLYGNEDPLGKTIKIDDHFPVTIASIFQDVPVNSSLQFDFVLPTEVFARMRGLPPDFFSRDFLPVYFKTNTSITPGALTEKLNEPSILTDDLKKDKVSYSAFPFIKSRLHGEFVNGISSGGRIQYVNLFRIVAIMVVAMAVINFVNLSTARAANRSKEIGIRKVTGAQRLSIVMQFMGESFMIVAVALVLSVISAQLLLPYFSLLTNEPLSIGLLNISVISWIWVFLVLVTIAAGLYPAVIMSAFQPAQVLKGTITTRHSGAQQLRKVLLVVQVAVSLGIVIFTGVLFQQLSFIQKKNLGLDSENILHIEPTHKLLLQYDAFKNELLAHPQIKQVTATNADPVNLAIQTTGVSWPGMPDGMNAPFKLLGGNFEMAETFGLTLLEGRMFGSQPKDTLRIEVVVSESAVKRMNLEEPIGAPIRIGNPECTIIGVIKDFHTANLKQEQLPVILYPHDLLQCSRLYVKYAPGTTAEAFALIESVYKKYEPAFTMKYHFIDEAFDKMYKTERTASIMLVFFTLLSLVITTIGVVGLVTYNVLKRRKEISIKRVLGATSFQILRMLSTEFILLIAVAALAGLPLAWYSTTQWLSGYAYRIQMPWWIFGVALAGITLITLTMIAIQGFKTIRTSPAETLRNE
ncbi:MAG: ABC transporter permease [Cyclobacteriaceae bacterium]|nr:ABC transporter permease [Cyclobacteriaceae bacterium]